MLRTSRLSRASGRRVSASYNSCHEFAAAYSIDRCRFATAGPSEACCHRTATTVQGADKLEHVATEHFWLSGVYWGLTALALLGRLDDVDGARAVAWVQSCFHPADGGFRASPRNDSHLLATTSALQVHEIVCVYVFLRLCACVCVRIRMHTRGV